MKFGLEKIYLIVSKDENLIATGVPRSRYISHISEVNKKRILTYASKKKAENGFQLSGFFVSDIAQKFIKEMYPEYKDTIGYISWYDIQDMFEARQFEIEYKSL